MRVTLTRCHQAYRGDRCAVKSPLQDLIGWADDDLIDGDVRGKLEDPEDELGYIRCFQARLGEEQRGSPC